MNYSFMLSKIYNKQFAEGKRQKVNTDEKYKLILFYAQIHLDNFISVQIV